MTILYILLFLVFLSLVVCLHELGHLSMAKIFNVYCYEYSIGFGKEIFKKRLFYKRIKDPLYVAKENEVIKPCKNPKYELVQSETYFSLRILPLGGYVSMAGEDNNEFENIKVPKERTIEGVNHAKQIIIFVAGVFFNFLLAFLLFFADYGLVTQKLSLGTSTNEILVSETVDGKKSLAYSNGIVSGDKILNCYQEYYKSESDSPIYFPQNGYGKDVEVYINYVEGTNYLKEDCVSYLVQDVFLYKYYNSIDPTNYSYPSAFKDIEPSISTYRILHLKIQKKDTNEVVEKEIRSNYSFSRVSNDTILKADLIGISATYTEYRNNVIEAASQAFNQFGNLFVQLYQALFSIFSPSGWKNVGGIISVYQITTSSFSSGNISYILFIWGYISLNLGCFNLLPFPGLDGWHVFLALIETISRKRINKKAKGIFSLIGLILLFTFAAVLLVKDILSFI